MLAPVKKVRKNDQLKKSMERQGEKQEKKPLRALDGGAWGCTG